MKRILLIAAMLFAGLFTYCYGQDVRVNINNQDYSNGDCGYKINGICSSEDIGGVEIQGKIKWDYDSSSDEYKEHTYAVLTNYNPFIVTVLFQDLHEEVYSIVLRANETKEVYMEGSSYVSRNPLPSKSIAYSIKGMIVRKLGQ